jgi:hypothetical protein
MQAYIRLLSTTFTNFGEVFGPGEHSQAEDTILQQSRNIAGQLEERARLELDALPFASYALRRIGLESLTCGLGECGRGKCGKGGCGMSTPGSFSPPGLFVCPFGRDSPGVRERVGGREEGRVGDRSGQTLQ